MQTIDDLLRSWGFGDYVQKFIDEEIDTDTLLLLPTSDIDKLIPKAGPRARFLSNCEKFKLSLRPASVEPSNANNKQLAQEIWSDSTSDASSASFNDVLLDTEGSDTDNIVTPSVPSEASGQKLRDLLNKSSTRKWLLHQTRLTALDRRHLVEIIVDHLLEDNLRIKSSTFQFWANEIVHVFKYERIGTYYVPYVTGSDGRLSGGKLWCRYCNVKRYVKRKNIVHEENSLAKATHDLEDQKKKYYLELKTVSPDDENAMKQLWEKTYMFRKLNQLPIYEYYKEFPILAMPVGSSLVKYQFHKVVPAGLNSDSVPQISTIVNFLLQLQQDFENSKICEATKCMQRWPEIAPDILRVVDERKVSLPFDIVNVPVETAALLALTYLLPPTNVKTGNKKKWRPSALEQGHGFILRINTMADLEEEIGRMKDQCRLYGLTLQPLVVAVGSPDNLQAVYVIVDEVKYAVTTLTSGVDLCLKVHYALSAKYNAQSEQLWAFIERYAFGIKSNKHYNNIEVLWGDINSR